MEKRDTRVTLLHNTFWVFLHIGGHVLRPTLEQMRHLAALERTGNFTAAARQCHISQPPFSRSIRRLEAIVGTALVSRERGAVTLTPAGRAFIAPAREALAKVDEALRAGRSAEPAYGRWRVGVNEYVYALLAPLGFEDFAKANAGLLIEPVDRPDLPADGPLLNRQLDLCFEVTGSPDSKTHQDGLQTALIHVEPMTAILPEGDPRDRPGAMAAHELEDAALVVFSRESAPQIHDDMLRTFREAGVHPRIALEANLLATMLAAVRSNGMVGLAPASVSQLAVPGVRFRTLEGAGIPRVHLFLSWRRADASSLTTAFVQWVRAQCPGKWAGLR